MLISWTRSINELETSLQSNLQNIEVLQQMISEGDATLYVFQVPVIQAENNLRDLKSYSLTKSIGNIGFVISLLKCCQHYWSGSMFVTIDWKIRLTHRTLIPNG